MKSYFDSLTAEESALFSKLKTPQITQDFLETIPQNFEREGRTILSPRRLIREWKAHCFEGAIFAAATVWFNGGKPLLLDLKTTEGDDDHVVALYERNKKWGAMSKTNHAVLRYRDAVYESPRELAMSYFHEYFLNSSGVKTLRSYAIFDLNDIHKNWIIDEQNLLYVDKAIEKAKHTLIIKDAERKYLRNADPVERKIGSFVVWKE